MKKHLFFLSVMLMGAALFTACDDDDEVKAPTPHPVNVSNGVFVVCSGNYYQSIVGSLSYYDYTTKTCTDAAFAAANGRVLGMTANDAVVYGNKLYIVVTNENTIEVVDKNTLQSVRQIKMTDFIEGSKGELPRHLAAANGKVYVTTYGESASDYSTGTTSGQGYVAVIDTASFALDNVFAVGTYPEGIAIIGNFAYVLNSDYSYGNASISQVNLTTGEDTKLTNPNILNPVEIAAIDGVLYYLDSGTYGPAPTYAQENAGIRKVEEGGVVTRVADATAMGVSANKLYLINAPYGSTTTSFAIYDPATSLSTALTFDEEPFQPRAINADPISGDIFVASPTKDPESGYANNGLPGTVNIYNATGSKQGSFTCGVGPQAIVFNTGVQYVLQ